MGYDGSLKFDTSINVDGFNSGVKKLGSIASGALKVLAGAVAGVSTAMSAGVAAGVKYNASIEQYSTSFEVMTGSAEKAKEVIETLTELGASTPFEMSHLAQTTQLLMNYGFTADDAIAKMKMLGDISQGSADKMNRIAMAYGQMSSAGKVSLEDVKQMIEAGFNPLQEISESTGESMASLYDRISDGVITVDEITAAMERATSAGGKYFESMQKQSQTFDGLVSTLKDNAMQLLGEVVLPISNSITSELLPAAIEAVEQLGAAFKEKGMDGLIDAGGNIIANIIVGLFEALPDLLVTAGELIVSVGKSLIEKTPIMLKSAISLITTLTDGIMEKAPDMIASGAQMLANFIVGIGDRLPDLIPQALSMVMMLADNIIANLPTIINAGTSLIEGLVQGLMTELPSLIPQALSMVVTLADNVIANMPTIIKAGISLLKGLIQGIIDSLPILIENGPRIINDFADAIYAGVWELIKCGGELLLNLIKGIWDNVPLLLANAGEIFMAFINIFTLSNLYNLGKNLINNLISGVKQLGPNILNTGESLVKNLVSGIKNMATHPVQTVKDLFLNAIKSVKGLDWKTLGKNIIDGIINGLKSAGTKLLNAAQDLLGGVLSSAKKFLGIHSPSTVFRDQIGKNMALGVGVGFKDNVPMDDMESSIDDSIQRMKNRVVKITTTSDSAGQTVGGLKGNPELNPEQGGFDFDEYERRQRKLNKERDSRPIFLGTDRIDRPLPKGAVPVW